MNIVNLCIVLIFLLALFYNNWIPAFKGWVQDRVKS